MPPRTAPEDTVEINGYTLREVRVMRGRKPSELAAEVACDRSYIAKIELGHNRRVSRVFFNKLIRALDVQDHRALLANPHRQQVSQQVVA
jgi:transcriptional regulator with XRE-family HTH domain